MAKTKKKDKAFSKTHLGRTFGIVAILLPLTVFLSANTHLRFLAYGIDFLFGLVGIYGLGIPLMLWGVYRLVHGHSKPLSKRLFFGWLFCFLGALVLTHDLAWMGQESSADMNPFFSVLDNAKNTLGWGLIGEIKIGGGTIGLTLAGLLMSGGGRGLVIGASSVSLLLGVVLLCWPLFLKAHERGQTQVALREAKKKKAQQDEIAAQVSPFGVAMPNEPLSMEEEQEGKPGEEKTRLTTRELTSFAPASKTLMPSRRSLRVRPAEQPLAQKQPETPTYRDDSGLAPFKSNGPIKTSGFRKAHFGAEEEEALPPVIPTTPKPNYTSVSFPDDDAAATIAVSQEPFFPQAEEEPKPTPTFEVPRPSFVAPEPIPEPVPEPSPQTEIPESPAPRPSFVAPEPIPEPIPEPAPMPAQPVPARMPEPEPKPEPKPEPVDPEAAVPWPPYELPPISLLKDIENAQNLDEMEAECAEREAIINKVYSNLGAGAHVVGHIIGPSVTQFQIQPDDNVSVATLSRYVKDIEMKLGGMPTRFEERVSGLDTCALEVANSVCRTISFKEMVSALPPLNGKNNMLVPFGEDIYGKVRFADLTEMPHMLIAGTTGSGKSVFIHGLLFSLLMRNRPEELKLVLVDPKRVEMNMYRDLPHLLCPIVKEPKEAKVALKKLCDEMDRRYDLFEKSGVVRIRDYNEDYCEYAHKKKLPFIVAVVDEFAELVMQEKEVADYVLRIGQKARAAGIHLIIATQRPDTKVITGTIKSNLPTRVALTTASYFDSQTILGVKGAEELNGKGDMLIDCSLVARNQFVRAQGAFVSSRDHRVIGEFIRNQMGPSYDPYFLDLSEKEEAEAPNQGAGAATFDVAPSESTLGAIKAAGDEEKYQMIKAEVMKREFTSISQIQRDYGVGFPRAGKIYSRLLKEGIISTDTPNSSKGAKVVVHASEPDPSLNPGSLSSSETSWDPDGEDA